MIPLITLLAGLFGGAGATVLWETVIKPRRDGRAFARLLLAELAVNRVIVKHQIGSHAANPNIPPAKGVTLYSTIFDSSANRLADLTPGVAALTYWAYRYFDRVNELSSRYWIFVESPSKPRSPEDIRRFMVAAKKNYLVHLQNCLPHIDKVRAALLYSSLPAWSIARRRLRSPVERYIAEMTKEIVGPVPELKPSDSAIPATDQ